MFTNETISSSIYVLHKLQEFPIRVLLKVVSHQVGENTFSNWASSLLLGKVPRKRHILSSATSFFFFWYWDWTQGLMLAIWHSTTWTSSSSICFLNMFLLTLAAWLPTQDLPVFANWVAGITGIPHHPLQVIERLFPFCSLLSQASIVDSNHRPS
jgi:hypothetical protein